MIVVIFAAVVGCVQPEHVFGGVVIVADYLLSCLYQFTALTDPSKEVEWKSVLHIPPALQHEVWPIERSQQHTQSHLHILLHSFTFFHLSINLYINERERERVVCKF